MATKFSAENFGKTMKDIAKRTGEAVEELTDASVKQLFTDVIEETPVGRPETWKRRPPPGYVPGKARANWMPSVGAPDTSVTESRQSSVSRLGQLSGISGNLVYLTNSVPYIYRLEVDGWSRLQAPNGWVERNVRSFENKLEKQARNITRR